MLVANLSVPSDRRVWHEARTLLAAGWEVSVVCPKGRARDREDHVRLEGIDIYRYDIVESPPSVTGYVREFATMLLRHVQLSWKARRAHRFTVIHACNPPDLFFVLGWLYRPFRVRFVFDQHDANPELYLVKFGRAGLHALLYRAVVVMERLSYATATLVIAPNDSYRQLALKRGRRRPEDVVVVRSGPRRDELAAPEEWEPEPATGVHRLGYLGVMGVQDGVDVLLDAVAELVRRRGREYVRLDLVGDGELREELEERAHRAGISDTVVFHGFLPAADFVPLLRSVDVCVAPDPPNAFNDISTMNKVIEYMAMGRPVVAFDLHETRDLMAEAGAVATVGDVAALADTLEAVLDDAGRRASMAAAAARIFAERLGWERSEAPLIEVYDRVSGLS
jgi:glycosyltransferase involved in cell wall biosynthesis